MLGNSRAQQLPDVDESAARDAAHRRPERDAQPVAVEQIGAAVDAVRAPKRAPAKARVGVELVQRDQKTREAAKRGGAG